MTSDIAMKTVSSGLDRIIFSLDGITQDVYQQYRKEGHLDMVIEGIRNLVQAKCNLGSSSPHIVIQFLVVRPNEHQIEGLYKLAADLKVDEVKLKSAQVYNYKQGNPLIPTQEKYSRYQRNPDGTYQVKNRLINHCWKMWHACVITWDGRIVPCCFDKDAKHNMGNLTQESFLSIWRGPEYQRFRTNILHSRKEIDICTNCTEGTKVWL